MSLRVSGLVTGYGKDPILHGVSFGLEPGTLTAVLGHNGAGKSSLVRALVGLLPVWKGAIQIGGRDVTADRSPRRIASGIAVSFQDDPVFPTLPVKANLELGAFVRRRDKGLVAARTQAVLELFPRLAERYDQPAYTMSGGERRMLSIGMALMSDPDIMVLDEPSTGLSPGMTELVFETIAGIRSRLGKAVLMVEQNVKQALEHADRALVLKTGQVVFDGPPGELAQDSTELVMLF
jgi:branched-chain amino acid transport system ATP-binding protein